MEFLLYQQAIYMWYTKKIMINIGIDNQAKEADKIYIGIDSIAKEAAKIYLGVNDTAKLVYEKHPFEKGYQMDFNYSGKVQPLTLPKGKYRLEVWGAQGGSYSSYYGGAGGYSTGILNLQEETNLFIYVGNQPASVSSTTAVSTGGFNGGGNGQNRTYSGTTTYGQAGGGATDIRINQDSLNARVIVAGGGGGSASVNALTTKYGGGETGGSPTAAYAGKQTAAGTNGSFGKGGAATTSKTNYKYGSGGGGGGWYGGGAYNDADDNTTAFRNYNGGGSGYVYTEATAKNYPNCLLNSTYYLQDAQTIAGNSTIPAKLNTTETATGNTGDGAARITYLGRPDKN